MAVYAPPLDPHAHLAAAMDELNNYSEDFETFLDEFSPTRNAANVKCPVLLFYAEDDDLIESATVHDYAQKLISAGVQASVVRTDSGGHYLPMIEEGIDLGIEWLRRIDTGEPLDDMISELEEMDAQTTLSGETSDGGEYAGEAVKIKLGSGFKFSRSDANGEDEFSISWKTTDDKDVNLHFRRHGEPAEEDLRKAAASLAASEGLLPSGNSEQELGNQLAPLELQRGVFEGFRLSESDKSSERDVRKEHFFLFAHNELWHSTLTGHPEAAGEALEVIESFRSASTENLSWKRIYAVNWDSPLHRVGYAPSTGGQSAPSNILKGDPKVKPNIGSMSGPVLELGITKETEVANPTAKNEIRYDQVDFTLPDESDAIRLSTDLYFEASENQETRYDLTIFIEINGAEAVLFGADGTAMTRGFGGLVRDRLKYPVGEVFPFQAMIHCKEGWVEFLVNGETLFSSPFRGGQLDPSRIRISYGGTLGRTLTVGLDNFVVESGSVNRSATE